MENKYHVWQRGFLPVNEQRIEPLRHWYQTDSYENYLRNGNREYGPEDITYQFNQSGYRSKEFSEIDHTAFKVLVIGCSNTLGLGLPLNETYGEQLRQRLLVRYDLLVEIINLGLGGRSIDYVARCLYQSVPILRPHYVFCLLPAFSRREYFSGNRQLHYIADWEVPGWQNHRDALLTLSNDQWDFYSFVKNLAFIELILRDHHWAWATWQHYDFDVSYFDVAHYRTQYMLQAERGKARDNIHSGAAYHRFVADDLLSDPNLVTAIAQYR